ncbi:hypothetical protein B484DRAFT_406454 [Ochromonadaceae sp. CCMP2298]|nr:hypothetical protein B484DRAFT_406454 [Ochromonadaceae sp. CCMP2298]
MSLNAEYMLKQSKIHMGIDSNLVLKSYLEAELSPKVTLQMCAEMQQATNHYRLRERRGSRALRTDTLVQPGADDPKEAAKCNRCRDPCPER